MGFVGSVRRRLSRDTGEEGTNGAHNGSVGTCPETPEKREPMAPTRFRFCSVRYPMVIPGLRSSAAFDLRPHAQVRVLRVQHTGGPCRCGCYAQHAGVTIGAGAALSACRTPCRTGWKCSAWWGFERRRLLFEPDLVKLRTECMVPHAASSEWGMRHTGSGCGGHSGAATMESTAWKFGLCLPAARLLSLLKRRSTVHIRSEAARTGRSME